MSKDTLSASVQYNDLKGTAAADRADISDASDFLRARGLMTDQQMLVGYDVHASTSLAPGGAVTISTNFLVAEVANMQDFAHSLETNNLLQLKRISLDLSPEEFFSLFKRFNLTLSSYGNLEGREYEYDE